MDSCGDATEFPQFGRHFDPGFVGFFQTIREFLDFLILSLFDLSCGRRLIVREGFLRLLLLGLLLLVVA